ncbi:replication initiator [Thermomonospora amylolytica]|uniref:replication initiator n=1 Tax=Thermomonospora amylolytica TaxID=1411117 RepID=UPI001F20B47A|nr:replication initiator [Thermomonospora amylolytica]
MIARVADPHAWQRWARQVEHAGHCMRPVRIYGRAFAVDAATGEIRATYSSAEEPDGTLLVACKDRRAAVCPACSRVYRADTWHLVAAGLRGRWAADGEQDVTAVPVSVVDHPAVFATFTAPSFGPVHRITPEGWRCRPRRARPTCPHGTRLWCSDTHGADDPRVGTPLCHRCYDYPGHVLWHATMPELWRRTVIYLYQELARLASQRIGRTMGVRVVRRLLRVSYVKVTEWQRRAAIHLHAVIRLDGIDADDPAAVVPPPSWADTGLLEEAIRDAAARMSIPLPAVDQYSRTAVWGDQLDITPVHAPERAAAYVAKYATKTAGDTLPHLPVTRFGAADLARLRRRGLSPHVSRLASTCFLLDRRPECADLRLAKYAHTLGFAGHFATKSRRYSTTMTALRIARRNWRTRTGGDTAADPWSRRDGTTVMVGDWRMVGLGYARVGDVELAATLAREHQEAREYARETAGHEEGGGR